MYHIFRVLIFVVLSYAFVFAVTSVLMLVASVTCLPSLEVLAVNLWTVLGGLGVALAAGAFGLLFDRRLVAADWIFFFFFNDPPPPEISPLSLPDAFPICPGLPCPPTTRHDPLASRAHTRV